LEGSDALDCRISYEVGDGAPLPKLIPVPVGDHDSDSAPVDGSRTPSSAAAAVSRKISSLGALRDAVVAAAQRVGVVHSSCRPCDFYLRLHGSDALVPTSHKLPVIWLWQFVAESGAQVVDDLLSSSDTAAGVLKVQLVRARDKHLLQHRHAAAMQVCH
jgi:hypothetical protein